MKRIYRWLEVRHIGLLRLLMSFKAHLPFSGNKFRIKGCNNTLNFNSANLTGTHFDVVGNNINIQIGDGSKLTGLLVYIRGDNHTVQIGRKCRFRRGGEIWMENINGVVSIGNITTVEEVHFASTEGGEIIVGNDCMLANDIDIRTGDSHSIISNDSGERINHAQDVNLKDHVWVGAHVRILKGTTIGKGSIIATSSVVSRSVPAGVISAGVPNKTIKNNIRWDRERL